MASWRDAASQQAQDDLDGLLDMAIPFAQEQLQNRGEFYPYAAAIERDGQPRLVAGAPESADDRPRSTDVIELIVEGLRRERSGIRAAAIVADVRMPQEGSDAIQINLEHEEGQAIAVLLPYAKKGLRKRIAYGDMRALQGEPRIWADG